MMHRPIIKLAFRQVIDASAKEEFERNVFKDTYAELLMQAQVYNREKKFATVAEMIDANPKANSLHYKIGFAIGRYVNELKKMIPGFVDALGNAIHFDIYKTEIIHSDVTHREKHLIALTYITVPLLLVDSFGQFLVLSKQTEEGHDEGIETFTVSLQRGLSVSYYQTRGAQA